MHLSDPHSDPHRWPLQMRQFGFGWVVTLYDPQGCVRHTVSVDSEIQAFRAAHRTARIYHHKGPVLVVTDAGVLEHELIPRNGTPPAKA